MRRVRENIMLAYPATTRRIQNLGGQFFIQPKYRGQRMRVEWFHGEPVLLSSYGVEFTFFEHIKEELMKLETKLAWDGEVYIHGKSQEEINSIANRTVDRHADSHKMQFHIFDYQSQGSPQLHRTKRLLTLDHDNNFNGDNPLRIVPTKLATTDTWQPYLHQWMEEGYEGIIFRNPNSQYYLKRNSCLLKFKPTSEDEYLIIDVYEAISKDGEPKNMVGGFTVKGDDGTEFNVGAGQLKHDKRIEYWKDRESLLGKDLLVKHEDEKTRHGKPVCAVALEVIK